MDNMQAGQRVFATGEQIIPTGDRTLPAAKDYKPTHGGYPYHMRSENIATMQVAQELVDAQSARVDGFNYGVGWGSSPMPNIYFYGVKLSTVLQQIAHEATARHWRLVSALRNVRLAETPTEKRIVVNELTDLIAELRADHEAEYDVRLLVTELADTVDAIAPEPKGYVPTFGINHAMHPVKKLIRDLLSAFKRTDG